MARWLWGVLSLLLGAFVTFASFGAKHDAWVEVRSPNFIIVSNAGEKLARKTAVQFEQIRSVFRQSLPVASAHPSPVITIFAAKDEDTLRSLLPEYWTKGHIHPSGIFYARMNQHFAAVNLEAQGTNPYETIYHEYYHSLTLPYFPDLPLWIGEGLADFYGNTEISSDHAGLGLPDRDLIAELQQGGGLIPLNVLFKVDHTSPYYNEASKTSMFYAESWALTHYLMLGDHHAHKQSLINYLDALNHGKSQEEAAAAAFGDLKKLQQSVERYIRGYAFLYQKAPPPPRVPDSDLQARILSDAEVDALKGGFAAARGRNDDARIVLNEALRLDPKLALAHQNLALVDFFEDKHDDALASVSRAVELDPKNALTRYLRAYLTFFSGPRVSRNPQIEADLRAAIASDPNFVPPCALLAVYLLGNDDDLPEALTLAQKAQAAEPGNSIYLLGLAQVLARMDRFDEAGAVATRARAAATVEEERSNAESFLLYLTQARSRYQHLEAPPDESATTDEAKSQSAPEPSNSAGHEATPAAPDRENEEYEQAAQGAKRAVASGRVLNVSCYGNDLRLTLAAHGTELTLRARNYARVDFTTTGVPPRGEFLPCKQLSGLEAKITFLPTENPTHGLIQAIELRDAGAATVSTASVTSQATTEAHNIGGTVTQSRCRERQLDIDVAAPSGTMHFHGVRGEFRLMLPQRLAQSGFDVCAQLKGQRVALRYAPGGGSDDGTILALRVLPAGASGGESSAARRPSAGVSAAPTTTLRAEGKVTEVACTGNDMLVKITTDNAQITLHARDYSRVNYDQDVGFDTKEFQPCSQLKDRTASITYTQVSNKPYSGEIQSIEVEQ